MSGWFRWFAWRPVWTRDRGWQWMRMVWRRHVPPMLGIPGACWTWDNRVMLIVNMEEGTE